MILIDKGAVQRWLADWQYGEAPNPGDTKEDKDKAIVRYEVLDIVRSGLDDPRFTIEAEPVIHGRWEYAEDEVLDDLTFSAWKCSCCGYYAYKPELWHYCPRCGAKMEVEDETD